MFVCKTIENGKKEAVATLVEGVNQGHQVYYSSRLSEGLFELIPCCREMLRRATGSRVEKYQLMQHRYRGGKVFGGLLPHLYSPHLQRVLVEHLLQ